MDNIFLFYVGYQEAYQRLLNIGLINYLTNQRVELLEIEFRGNWIERLLSKIVIE